MAWVHRLTSVDTENKTAECAECGHVDLKIKPDGRRSCGNKSRQLNRNHKRKIKYNLTEEQYGVMVLQQSNKCLICGDEVDLVVDHDHSTGKIRGLLCHTCNIGLGMFKDNIENLERSIEYLKNNT